MSALKETLFDIDFTLAHINMFQRQLSTVSYRSWVFLYPFRSAEIHMRQNLLHNYKLQFFRKFQAFHFLRMIKISKNTHTYLIMIPFSTEKLSVGNPKMFQSRILTGSPRICVGDTVSQQGTPVSLQTEVHSVVCS